jgi:hypothetical protein
MINRRGQVLNLKYHGSVSAPDTWLDKSGNNNDGTLNGDAYINSNGANFDGSGDYTKGAASSGVGNGPYTVGAWIYGVSPLYNVTQAIISQRNASGRYPFLLGVEPEQGKNTITLVGWDGTATYSADSGITPSASNWYYVVGTYDGTNLNIYINGEFKNSVSTSGHSDWSNSDAVTIGAREMSSSRLYLDGIVDNVQIYNTALTSTQITALYNAGRTGNIPSTIDRSNLKLWMSYIFSGIPGLWYDVSGNGNDLTLNGDAYVNSSGINLDGTGDYAEKSTPGGVVTASGSPFALSAWIKTAKSGLCVFLAYGSGSSKQGRAIFQNASSYIGFGGNGSDVVSTTTINDNNWHFVVVSYSGSSFSIYVDAAVVKTGTNTLYDITGTTYARIGASLDSPPLYPASGTIDDATIYNRALSQSEINQNFHQTKGRHS